MSNFKRVIWHDHAESVVVIKARGTRTADYFEVGLSTLNRFLLIPSFTSVTISERRLLEPAAPKKNTDLRIR